MLTYSPGYKITYTYGCPLNSTVTGSSCTCNDPTASDPTMYVPDSAQTSCVPEPLTIALQIPLPAEVEAGVTKSAYAQVMNGSSPQGGVQVNLAVTPPAGGGVATLVPDSGVTGSDGQLAFTFSAPEIGIYSLTASCSPACMSQATGVIEVKAKCPVDPLAKPPFSGDVNPACTASLEAGSGKDVNNVCPKLNPKMTGPNGGQMQCLADKINKLALTPAYTGPSATIRTEAYQQHFVDIWKKSKEIAKLKTEAEKQACAAVIADVKAEMKSHGIDAPPSKKKGDAPHVLGNALDISRDVAKAMMAKLTDTTVVVPVNCFLGTCMAIPVYIGDVQDYVNSPTVNPPACDLRWGGRFGDKVHFQLQHP